MRPDEPKSFDPHEPIDLRNPAKVREMTEKLDCSEDDLVEAVERVGPQPAEGCREISIRSLSHLRASLAVSPQIELGSLRGHRGPKVHEKACRAVRAMSNINRFKFSNLRHLRLMLCVLMRFLRI